jgi:EmrB/QacA subfamily drug resistance transporter
MNDSESKRAALITAVTGSFVTPFMGSSINVALPSIARDFRMDAVTLSWIATSYLLAAAAFLVPLGRVADIYGRKKVYTLGMSLFTVAGLLCSLSVSATMLIFFRVCQGIGAAMIFSTGLAIISSVFPPEERGGALGINVAVVYIGLSIGPFIGGIVTEHFSWRGVFLLMIPIGVLSVALAVFKLKGEWAEAAGEKFDLAGSVIYGATLVSAMYALSVASAVQSAVLLAIAACGAVGFVKWETHVKNPVFDVRIFRSNRVFTFSCFAALINYSATFAITFLMSIYLQHVLGYGPQSAGLVMIVQPAIMAVVSPLAGRLSDRIEPRIVASAGMALTAGGLFVLGFLQDDSSLRYLIACLATIGLGFALFSSPNANAIMSSVEHRLYGIASGAVGTMRLLGNMLSMGIATLIFAAVIGRVEITTEHHFLVIKALHWAFFVFAGLSVPGILMSLARGPVRGPRDSTSWYDASH